MSHFTVMVVTDTDSEYELQEALAPFNEQDEDYFEWVDEHDRLVEKFENDTDTVYQNKEDKSYVGHYFGQYPNNWHIYFDTKEEYEKFDESPKDIIRKGWSGNRYYALKIPDTYDVFELTYKEIFEIQGKTFEDWLQEFYGYDEHNIEDGRWGDRYNPNSKWDWWVVGGRWKGMLQVHDPKKAHKGSPSWTNDKEEITGYDRTQVGNLDFLAMKKAEEERLEKNWKEAHTDKYDEKSREFVFGIKVGMTKDEYVQSGSPFTTYAVLMDGEWHEKGTMGWWGISTGDDENWDTRFRDLLSSLDRDKWITIIDCHI